MILGLDIGNRYAKAYTEHYMDEVFVAWKEVSEEEYNLTNPAEITSTLNKAAYKGKFYIVGDVGNTGIHNKNKGASEVVEESNLIKLVMLARYLKNHNKTEYEDFKIVTGTPYDDYEKNKVDYLKLMKSKDTESFVMDGIEYKIKVSDADVTKQGACTILTLPDRKNTNYLIWDFGGETLDVSYFENGVRIKGLTKDFALNRLYVELGKHLNNFTDIDRPSLLDARYQKSIENLVLTGRYKSITTCKKDGEIVDIKLVVDEYLQEEVNKVINDVANELDFSQIALDNLKNIFVGGGSKTLETALLNNKKLKNKNVQEEPQYSNVRAYYKIGKVTWNE